MICPKCKTENTTRNIYCRSCGAELDHSLKNVQASVDKEIKRERIVANARRVRWLLGFSVLLFAAGSIFRRTYKDLPTNSVTAFAAAPGVELDTHIAPKAVPFDVALPKVTPGSSRRELVDDQAILGELTEEARRRRSVKLQRKGLKDPLIGLLVGDLVFYAKEPGTLTLLPIYIAQVRSLRPAGKDAWEIRMDGRADPIRIELPSPGGIQVRILIHEEGKEPTVQPVPLGSIENIQPLE